MMKKKWVIAFAVLFVLMCAGIPFLHLGRTISPETASAAQTKEETASTKNKKLTGLQKIDGKYYYYVKGEAVTSTYKKVNINGVNYYFYFQKDGSAYTEGYRKVTSDSGKTYYCFFKKNGRAYADGLKKVAINGVNYYFYFDKNGRAVTDKLKKVTDSRGNVASYYFRSNGRALTNSFKVIDGSKYYFMENGKACTEGKHNISHYLCYFDENGALTRRIDKNKKMIALTYDDGPSKYTYKVLDVMEEYNSVCTFFIVGNRVSSYKDFVKREAELGCELANHTYDHEILTKLDSRDEIREQVEKCNDTIEALTGIRPKLVRTPGGGRNDMVDDTIGMPNILWSVDTLDWKTRDTDATIKSVKEEAYDGAIILMHDLHEATTDAAKTIVPYLIDQGYQLVTVSEMAECRGVELEDGTRYYSMRPQK
ncbi:MAG: polysaccharide deacetylase family protein [Agathobacter sp.]|nr:polysaccharide deacetylase family protein [Agathobacter sp.]